MKNFFKQNRKTKCRNWRDVQSTFFVLTNDNEVKRYLQQKQILRKSPNGKICCLINGPNKLFPKKTEGETLIEGNCLSFCLIAEVKRRNYKVS